MRWRVGDPPLPPRSCEHSEQECNECRIERYRSIQLEGRPQGRPEPRDNKPPATPEPAWERGVPSTRRRDGSQMPFLMQDGSTATQKTYSENRRLWRR